MDRASGRDPVGGGQGSGAGAVLGGIAGVRGEAQGGLEMRHGSGREIWALPTFLFDDGFESSDTTAWSATVP